MKSLVLVLLFVSTFGYSQISDFNFSDYRAFKMSISNLSQQEQAVYLARITEKNFLAEFSWIDFKNGMGYFLIKKSNTIDEIERLLIDSKKLVVSDVKEITLNDDFFLEMYMQKGGINGECVLNQPPNYIYLGKGNEMKSESLYQVAKRIWVSKYPDYYNAYYNVSGSPAKEVGNNSLPEHFPVYKKTGNSEYDDMEYAKAKLEWINNYPEEVEQYRLMEKSN